MHAPDEHKPPVRLHALMIVVGICFLIMVARFVVPVLLAACLAGVVMPVHNRIRQRLRLSNPSAAGITTLLMLVGAILPFILLSVAAVRSLLELVNLIGKRISASAAGGENVTDSLFHEPWVVKITTTISSMTPLSENEIRGYAGDLAQKIGVFLGQALGNSLQDSPAALIFLFILVVALYYFMVDGARLEAWIIEQSPFNRDTTLSILSQVKDTSARTLGSSVVVAMVQSSLLFIGMLISGIPAPFIWFTVAFLMAFLPLIGTVPVSIGCIIYLAAQGQTGMATLMVVLAVLAGLSDNIVRPLVIGSGEKQQHPLITLMSIFGGLGVIGFAGLFLGPVLASLFTELLERYTLEVRPPEPELPQVNVPVVQHDA